MFGILLLAGAIFFLYLYDTGRWSAVLSVIENPSAAPSAIAEQTAEVSNISGGGSSSGGGTLGTLASLAGFGKTIAGFFA